jgi:hypothetical protein
MIATFCLTISSKYEIPHTFYAGNNKGVLIGIVLGAVLGSIALVVIGVFYYLCEKRKRAQQLRNSFPVPRPNKENPAPTPYVEEDGIPEPTYPYNPDEF